MVAQYLKQYLENNNLENDNKDREEKIYLTKPEKEFKDIAKNIMNVDIKIDSLS